MRCQLYELGRLEYPEAYEIQQRLWSQRVRGRAEDVLLILEHPPTITMGRSAGPDSLLLTGQELADRGISCFFTDRGGGATYHGPGQLVAHPILDLKTRGKDVHRYVDGLLEVTIRTLADLSIAGRRDDRHVGVWVGSEKIAAVGVAVRQWVTTHGLALNVAPNLDHFSFINPCGIPNCRVTSISRLLGHDVPLDEVRKAMAAHFADVFEARVERLPVQLLRRAS